MIQPVLIALALMAAPAADPAEQDRAAILATIERMEAAWNRGDFPGYMSGFKKPDAVFVSGGRFLDGWQGRLDQYVRDYGGGPERRGTLKFYDMTVELLAPDAAMLVGKYRMDRPGRVTHGINTRLFRKMGGRWLITMNHVSAYDEPTSARSERGAR
ncbi:nuclear transport factor 2 family protein [Sphingomonas lutea]|uniref:Nuclear transport factor 2 family protein n=1 Tax=Sphingomonas lutea TaxID=1045317 RepID=A0A7G9SHP0_9SPHN|nr:nuclear transport factor 2 family protein [Sphingomonas lutea]QNN67365.1 nuclear transport factor 2 family protein [Sphingomonas lutea]